VTDRIDLNGIEVMARHGVLAEEKKRDQLFVIDVSLFLDLQPASSSDDVADTVDYGELAGRIHQKVAGETHDLIEAVAADVAGIVLEDSRVERVVVTVHKPQAPIVEKFGDVSVTVDRAR
jgi:dihydroneopterin aldolase